MDKESSTIWKFIGFVLFGVGLTYAYVRFGYELPGVVQLGEKVATEAIVSTAEIDLYDPQAPMENRQRALAIVVGHRPELFTEVDDVIGNRFFEEVLRRKAVRQAKLLKGRDRAYEMALEKPALREVFVKKHGVQETDQLKRSMLISDLRDEEFLYGYLRRRFPQTTPNELAELVLGVYQNELRQTEEIAVAEKKETVME